MEVVIRLVDRGLPKNRSQRVALNAAYSARHADPDILFSANRSSRQTDCVALFVEPIDAAIAIAVCYGADDENCPAMRATSISALSSQVSHSIDVWPDFATGNVRRISTNSSDLPGVK
jgi:hypothetical protein